MTAVQVPTPPENEPTWDISYTRMAQVLLPQIEIFTQSLARQFQAFGIITDTQVRPTPRGLSTFLSLIGERSLICIIEFTVIDGMAVGHKLRASVDIRLLDACGDLVGDGLCTSADEYSSSELPSIKGRISESLKQAATTVYVTTLAQFDLLHPPAQPYRLVLIGP